VLSDAFSAAVQARDPEALSDALAEDVSFRSPVVFRPYRGRPLVSTILTEGAMKVFEDFRYTDRLEGDGSAALVFEARVGEREVVMVRPMSALNALAAAMAERFERLGIAPPGPAR
jgi:hypothetical protein